MKKFDESNLIQENGCLVLAHMASNNLGTMPNVAKCVMYVNNSMQMTVGSTLHSTAMVATTALFVERFSCNHATSQPHTANQDAFANAGILNLMLSSLNEYAKTSATWAMRVVVNDICALDALCWKNTKNTRRFVQANSINIMVKAVFRTNNSVVPISNFRDECWMAMFTMIETSWCIQTPTPPLPMPLRPTVPFCQYSPANTPRHMAKAGAQCTCSRKLCCWWCAAT